jgi:hypothetical protein
VRTKPFSGGYARLGAYTHSLSCPEVLSLFSGRFCGFPDGRSRAPIMEPFARHIVHAGWIVRTHDDGRTGATNPAPRPRRTPRGTFCNASHSLAPYGLPAIHRLPPVTLFRVTPQTQYRQGWQPDLHAFCCVRNVCAISRGDFDDDPRRSIDQFDARAGRPATRWILRYCRRVATERDQRNQGNARERGRAP